MLNKQFRVWNGNSLRKGNDFHSEDTGVELKQSENESIVIEIYLLCFSTIRKQKLKQKYIQKRKTKSFSKHFSLEIFFQCYIVRIIWRSICFPSQTMLLFSALYTTQSIIHNFFQPHFFFINVRRGKVLLLLSALDMCCDAKNVRHYIYGMFLMNLLLDHPTPLQVICVFASDCDQTTCKYRGGGQQNYAQKM